MHRSQVLIIQLQEAWASYNRYPCAETHKSVTNLIYRQLPQAIDEDIEIKFPELSPEEYAWLRSK